MLHSSSFLYLCLDSVNRLIASVLFCQTKCVLHYQANFKSVVQVYIQIQMLIQTWNQMWIQDPNSNSNLKGQIWENSILRKFKFQEIFFHVCQQCQMTELKWKSSARVSCCRVPHLERIWYNVSTSMISSSVAQLWLAWLSLVGCLGSNPGPIKLWLF